MIDQTKKKSLPWLDKKLKELEHFEDGLGYKKVLVMGRAGSGKTTFAGSFPNWLILDFDKNTRVLEELDDAFAERLRTHRIPFSRGDDVETGVKQTLQAFKEKIGPFAPGEQWDDVETIIIDSIHKYVAFLGFYILTKIFNKPETKKMGYDEWGLLKSSLEKLGELIKDVPCHVVATCGVKTYDKDDGTQELMAMIDGAYRDLIAHEYGEVYYFDRIKRGSGVRYRGYSNVYGNIKMLKSTTKSLPEEFENPTYERLYIKKEFT